MLDPVTLRSALEACVRAVEDDERRTAYDSLAYSERLGVTVGRPVGADVGELACLVEVLDPAVYFDPDWLEPGTDRLADTHPAMASAVDDLGDAVSQATDGRELGPLHYCGLEPGTAASSAVFRGRIAPP